MIPPPKPQKKATSYNNLLPVNKNIHVLVTAGDVLHSFAMPSLGVKKDAVPGRLNETWMRIDRPGIYRGNVQRFVELDMDICL